MANYAEALNHNARVRTGDPNKLDHLHIEHHMNNGEVRSYGFEPGEGHEAIAHISKHMVVKMPPATVQEEEQGTAHANPAAE